MVSTSSRSFLRPATLQVPGAAGTRFAAPASPAGLHLPSPRSSTVTATATATSAAYASVEAATPRLAAPASLYDVLGLPIGATGEEIKSAYRRRARECHPDARRGAAPASAAAEEFMRVHAAYSTLSDPDKRADYDRRVMRLRHGPASPRPRSAPGAAYGAASFAGFTRRTWETDQCW